MDAPYNTGMTTEDGLAIYDLAPQSGDLIAVAGPEVADAEEIADGIDWEGNWEELPDGFRWIDGDEWAAANERRAAETA